MKIEVAKSDLEKALRISNITVGSGADLSSHYLFRVNGGSVEILSYDMRAFSRAPLKSTFQGEDGDAFTIEAWRLDRWVSGVGDGTLSLSYSEGDVQATGPRSKVRFRSLDPSKFPFWDSLLMEFYGLLIAGHFLLWRFRRCPTLTSASPGRMWDQF
jgi:hypothetical protein